MTGSISRCRTGRESTASWRITCSASRRRFSKSPMARCSAKVCRPKSRGPKTWPRPRRLPPTGGACASGSQRGGRARPTKPAAKPSRPITGRRACMRFWSAPPGIPIQDRSARVRRGLDGRPPVPNRAEGRMASLKGSKTEDNLKAAFAGESQANRRYLYFAQKADVEGYNDVSAVFRSTAEGETGHAHGHLEYTDMYPGMARTARDEGFDEIADWFETLAKAEKSHAGRFQRALDGLD